MSEPKRTLGENGRCYGRKPLIYKRPRVHGFCMRCCREYDGNEQVENWAWKQSDDGTFTRKGGAE